MDGTTAAKRIIKILGPRGIGGHPLADFAGIHATWQDAWATCQLPGNMLELLIETNKTRLSAGHREATKLMLDVIGLANDKITPESKKDLEVWARYAAGDLAVSEMDLYEAWSRVHRRLDHSSLIDPEYFVYSALGALNFTPTYASIMIGELCEIMTGKWCSPDVHQQVLAKILSAYPTAPSLIPAAAT
jgi:hypothetical protein